MPALDVSVLENLKEDYKKYPIFVETGTLNGATILSLEKNFEELHTIELSEKYYTRTKNSYFGNKITFHLGDSGEVLKTLSKNLDRDTIFFLDGHYSSGDTAKGNKDCPLEEELLAIKNNFIGNAIIIVDDFRLFGRGPKNGFNEDWSDISKEKLLNLLGERVIMSYHLESIFSKDDRFIIHLSKI